MAIIFFPGITESYVKSLLDAVIDDIRKSRIDELPGKREYICDIPSVFTCLGKWPQKIDLDCWYCCRQIQCRPVPVPSDCNRRHGKLEVDVEGVCDTWNCAQAYINEVHGRNRLELTRMLRLIYPLFNEGQEIQFIPPAPPKFIMKRFCGPKGITDKEYQKKINDLQYASSSISFI